MESTKHRIKSHCHEEEGHHILHDSRAAQYLEEHVVLLGCIANFLPLGQLDRVEGMPQLALRGPIKALRFLRVSALSQWELLCRF